MTTLNVPLLRMILILISPYLGEKLFCCFCCYFCVVVRSSQNKRLGIISDFRGFLYKDYTACRASRIHQRKTTWFLSQEPLLQPASCLLTLLVTISFPGQSLKERKGIGHNSITIPVLDCVLDNASEILSNIVNLSFSTGSFPSKHKKNQSNSYIPKGFFHSRRKLKTIVVLISLLS